MNQRLIALVLFGLAMAGTARAEAVSAWKGSSTKVAPSQYIPKVKRGENKDAKYYMEQYTFDLKFDGGHTAYVQFIFAKPFVSSKCAVKSELTLKDKGSLNAEKTLKLSACTFAKDKFLLRMAGSVLQKTPKGFRIEVSNKKHSATYEIENIVPPWRPGKGKIEYGSSKRYYQYVMLVPRGRVSARVRPAGEDSWRELKGYVYADYSVTNVPPHEQAKRWIRFRKVMPDHTVTFVQFYTSDRWGKVPVSYVVIASNKELVFGSADNQLVPRKLKPDSRSAEGYQMPLVIDILGKSGGKRLKGRIVANKLVRRTEMLSKLNPLVRKIVSKFSNPVDYDLTCRYRFMIKGASLKLEGKGKFSVTHITP